MNPNKKRREISSNISCLNMAHKTPDHGQKILIPRFKFNRSTESPVQWVRFLPISSNLALNSVSWLKIYKSILQEKYSYIIYKGITLEFSILNLATI